MRWLAPIEAFKQRLAAANKMEDARQRLEALSSIANCHLSFLETIQLDTALRKTLNTPGSGFDGIKLAVLTGSTGDHLLPPIRVGGLRRGLHIEAYATGYGQYRHELLDPTSQLHSFKPNVALFSLVARDFIGSVPVAASIQEADAAIAAAVKDIREMWLHARSVFGGLVIQQSFLDVEPALFGGLDAIVPGAHSRLALKLNMILAEAAHKEGVLWLDAARASSRDGLDVWFDAARWLQAKMEIAPQAVSLYGDLTARLVAAARGKSKKCLVLDLDNTLWGGVIGDDGIDGIVLGQGSAAGEAHLALQRYAKALKDRGVILAVCSKNELNTAESVFRDHPEMLLKRSDIACFIANWTDKATNLRTIAQQLNISLDSLVFVDDNPVERDHVRSELPMVMVPELPLDPANYMRCLADAGYFEAVTYTQEDRERGDQYTANAERENLLQAAGGIDGFLEQLNMVVEFGQVRGVHIARATQLINKTNQFNTTTIRRTAQEVEALVSETQNLMLQFRLIDKFGDNGLVSVMTLTPSGGAAEALDLVNWVMSCRVFSRQLEEEAMNILVETAKNRGVQTIKATYAPTQKNAVVKDLFEKLGFLRVGEANDGGTQWALAVDSYAPRKTWITRKEIAND